MEQPLIVHTLFQINGKMQADTATTTLIHARFLVLHGLLETEETLCSSETVTTSQHCIPTQILESSMGFDVIQS